MLVWDLCVSTCMVGVVSIRGPAFVPLGLEGVVYLTQPGRMGQLEGMVVHQVSRRAGGGAEAWLASVQP